MRRVRSTTASDSFVANGNTFLKNYVVEAVNYSVHLMVSHLLVRSAALAGFRIRKV